MVSAPVAPALSVTSNWKEYTLPKIAYHRADGACSYNKRLAGPLIFVHAYLVMRHRDRRTHCIENKDVIGKYERVSAPAMATGGLLRIMTTESFTVTIIVSAALAPALSVTCRRKNKCLLPNGDRAITESAG